MTHHTQQLNIDIQEWQKPIEKLWEIYFNDISAENSDLTSKNNYIVKTSSYSNHTLLRSFLIIYEHSKNVFDYEHPFEYRSLVSKHITAICTTILETTFISTVSFAFLIQGRVKIIFYNLSDIEKIKKKVKKEFSRKDLTSADFITNLTGISKTASNFFDKFTHRTFSKELILIKPNGTIEEVPELPAIKEDFKESNIIFKIIDLNTYNINTKYLMGTFKGGKYLSIKTTDSLQKDKIVRFLDNGTVEQNTDKRRWVKFASRVRSSDKTKNVCICCLKLRTKSIMCGGCNVNICNNCSFCRVCSSVLIDFNNMKCLEKLFKQCTMVEKYTETSEVCIGCNCRIETGKIIGWCNNCDSSYCYDCYTLITKYNMSCNKCLN